MTNFSSPRRGVLGALAATLLLPAHARADTSTFSIDSHNHIDVPGPAFDLAGALRQSGLSAICMTFAVDYQALRAPGEAFERFQAGMAALDQLLVDNKLQRSLNLADLRRFHAQRQPTVIQSVEGGHFLEGQIDRLEMAYLRGLRHLTLLHDNDASVPLGDVFTNPVRWGGLTPFGAQVIAACNRLGILVDLGHADGPTVAAALKVTSKPVIISHTGLDTQLGTNPAMARMMRPRLISAAQARTVADAGGVIGVWTHLTDSADAYAANLRAMVDVAGIDHVCIGTDTKLAPSSRGGGTNHTWPGQQHGFYDVVVAAMVKAGFSGADIDKISGANFCRVFDAATAVRG